jgi:hypothetical protein
MAQNVGKRWTDQEDEELRARIRRHERQIEIAQALGRTFTAVGSRAQVLGLRLGAPLRPRHGE